MIYYYYYKVSFYNEITDNIHCEEGLISANSYVEATERIQIDYGENLEEISLKMLCADGYCFVLDDLKQAIQSLDAESKSENI